MSGNNMGVVPMFKDGDEGSFDANSAQVIIDVTSNGFVINIHGETELNKVYLFSAKGEDGPKGMIQDIINNLGIADKVKLEK